MRIHFALSIALCLVGGLAACADNACTASGATDTTRCVVATSAGATSGAIQYTNAPALAEPARSVPIRLDRAFNLYERAKISRAINEWNHVLNGAVRLEISADEFTTAATGEVIRPQSEGWIVAKVDSRYPMLGNPAMKRTLALTVGTRRAIIFVVADRIGNRDLGGILMHEFGHALGAGHDSGSALMHPYYAGDKQHCIDKGAVQAVAVAQRLSLANLNWCGDSANVAALPGDAGGNKALRSISHNR